jgi:hypothetical protein
MAAQAAMSDKGFVPILPNGENIVPGGIASLNKIE